MRVYKKKSAPPEPTIVVELSLNQVKTLQRIFFSVGGDSELSRRKHVKELSELLRREVEKHVPGNSRSYSYIPGKGQFFFEDESPGSMGTDS